MIEQADTEEAPETRPRIFFSSITFQDGTEIKLGNNDIVVFVGGNNAGKSQALKDLEHTLGTRQTSRKVITQTIPERMGTIESLLKVIKESGYCCQTVYGVQFGGTTFSTQSMPIFEQSIGQSWKIGDMSYLANFFCRRIQTEKRIVDSDPAPAFDTINEAPSNPIQFIYSKTLAEEKLSSYFQKTFNQDLRVDKGVGNNLPLLAGEYISPQLGEDRTDSEYRKRLHGKMSLLREQGDGMRSFASVILQTLADPVPSILLLDEPEAFLHPPQAKILGRLLAKERSRDAQLFIATHSVDILMGLLEAAPENLHIIRLNREEKRAVELNKDKAKEIMRNPLLRYSNVLSGAFYKRVILCEDSSDCLFYQALLGAMEKPVSDALFLHTSGKDRLNQLAEILQALEVRVAIIADIDILQNSSKGTFKNIIAALGGDWEAVEKLWTPLKRAIEQEHPQKSAAVIHVELQEKLEKLKENKSFELKDIRELYENTLKKSSPWPMLKRAGKNALPKGDARRLWKELQKLCAETGLWIVPMGEIESFADTGGHGPQWVEKVLEDGALESRAELEEARKFLRAVWDNKPDTLN